MINYKEWKAERENKGDEGRNKKFVWMVVKPSIEIKIILDSQGIYELASQIIFKKEKLGAVEV